MRWGPGLGWPRPMLLRSPLSSEGDFGGRVHELDGGGEAFEVAAGGVGGEARLDARVVRAAFAGDRDEVLDEAAVALGDLEDHGVLEVLGGRGGLVGAGGAAAGALAGEGE